MGGTKDSSLLPFGEAFAEAGLDVLLFDYRGFGESGGEPRQDAWPPLHREDLRAALEFARGLEGVDPSRIVLWGWSWGCSHCIYVATESPDGIAAMITVGPAVDGLATMRHLGTQIGPGALARLTAAAARDVIARARDLAPVMMPMVGPPGSFAALTTEESESGYTAIAGSTWRNEVTARVALGEWTNRAVGRADRIRCPILIQGGETDSIAPVESARKLAWEAKGFSELREYVGGHFDFLGGLAEQVLEDQLHFLRRHFAGDRAGAAVRSGG